VAVKVLVISGSMGSGKTTVLGEASDILAEHGAAHAAIDLDAIGTVLLPDHAARLLSLRNLAAVYSNFVAAGITRLLLAEAVVSREDVEQLQQAMSGAELVVCRLTADLETMQRRIRIREPGIYQARFVDRSRTLHEALEAAKLEDFIVVNDGRAITDVAREVLVRAGWIA
jgi:adenylylsulfate kinase-like enzyme